MSATATLAPAGRAGVPPAGTASMPSARVPPPTTANSPADRRARRPTGVLRRARPAGLFVSLVAAMGDYLHLHRDTTVPGPGGAVGEA